jgi:hypothetical protein
MAVVFIFIGLVGLVVSASINDTTMIFGFLWRDISLNIYGVFMSFLIIGSVRLYKASHPSPKKGRSGRGRKSRSHRRKRGTSKSTSGMEHIHWAHKARTVKLYAAWFLFCLVTALVSTLVMKADLRSTMESISSFMLFGSSDPYMSPKKTKQIDGEMRNAIKEILK